VPAADGQVVGAGDMAVPAVSGLDEFPEIVTAYFDKLSFFTDILNPGDVNTGCTTVIADHAGLVGNGSDDLVSHFFTVIAVCAVFCSNEPVAHGR